MNQHLFLTGFMGSGKTTVGLALSKKLGIPVVDLDELIVKKTNKTINAIFEEEGEAAFRLLETKILLDVCKHEPLIVTTGGGIILHKKNRQAMKESGIVIFLYCEIKEVITRLRDDQSRPLFKGTLEEKENRFQERLPLYREANFTINTTKKEVESIVEEIMLLID
ncbi:MAG: shikimate kinase [Bacillaceae bacterium]|nr:shikimate kinase [Bacillaceae bacterium]